MERQLGLSAQNTSQKVSVSIWLDFSHHFLLQMESNAKVVEWSDGTKSLVIGDQIFEI